MERKSRTVRGKTGQKFQIRRADSHDLDGIMEVMETAKRVTREGWFISDDRQYVEEHIEKEGFIVVAETDTGEIAGFFMIDFPGERERNMGRQIGLSKEERQRVAHMDSAAVLPQYRGNHLQQEMMGEAEEILDQTKQYRYRMGTVCPENVYSLYNLQKRGYIILMTVKKYGGYPRHIMWKDAEQEATDPFAFRQSSVI